MIQRHLWISGKVQGVGFRAFVLRSAKKLGPIQGYVRNLPDGRVEVVFAGPQKAVLTLAELCRKGPPSARVDQVQVQDEKYDPSWDEFKIL